MMQRINMTLDDGTLEELDGIANAYGMNRSETIRFMVELMEELNAWNVLENVAIDANDELYYQPTKHAIKKAARSCHVERD